MGVPVTQTRAAEFRETLGKRVLVADGATGTMLYGKRPFVNRCLDELNLSLPALVRDVHREYARAGAEILRTNTFGANRQRLGTFGFAERVRQINQAAVRIAREVARDQAFVAGAVGPLGVRLDPLGATTCAEARAFFREQIEALLEAGVDLLVLETFRDLGELREAIIASREAAGPEMVVAAHVSIEDDGWLADGASTESFTRRLEEWPVDIGGLNCSSGPRVILDTIERMTAYTSKPLSAMPSAGLAGAVCSPEYLAQYARRFVRAGAQIVGGCCGTTPEHIRAVYEAVHDEVQAMQPGPLRIRVAVEEAVEPPKALPKVSLAGKSHLGAKLADGRFVILAEIQPPRGADAAGEIEDAKLYKAAGFDAVTVTAGPGARLSATAVCELIQQQASIDTVLSVAGRGRSIRSIESELLGAHALGVRNILCSGEDSAAMASIVNHLNQGLDAGGNSIGSQTALALGVQANPALPDQLEAKVQLGAEFVLAQPVFDLDIFEAFVKHAEQYKLPVVAGIWRLSSLRDAEYVLNELRTQIPAEYMARMNVAEDGAAIALELVERLRGMAAGVQLSAPFGGRRMALEMARAMGPK